MTETRQRPLPLTAAPLARLDDGPRLLPVLLGGEEIGCYVRDAHGYQPDLALSVGWGWLDLPQVDGDARRTRAALRARAALGLRAGDIEEGERRIRDLRALARAWPERRHGYRAEAARIAAIIGGAP